MNKEEIESFKELNTDLEDIDDLDMGLEIISYKVRTTMQEFANTIINLQSQLDTANKKLERVSKLKPEELAIMFHNTYEKLAPDFGYETRKDTKIFNKNSANGKLMIEVCKEILSIIGGE